MCDFYYRIDCINNFVHREMNLKNGIAHFMKAKGEETGEVAIE